MAQLIDLRRRSLVGLDDDVQEQIHMYFSCKAFFPRTQGRARSRTPPPCTARWTLPNKQCVFITHLSFVSDVGVRHPFPPPVTFQVMNILQMTVLAGSPGGFLPNMYPGMVAATLARVIRTSAGGSWAGVEVRATP